MLVTFVVDADSLTPDPDWTSAQVRACHNNFLSAWRQIGLLVVDGDSPDRSNLRAAIAKLPQSVRSLWQEVLERLPSACCGNGWNGSVARQSIPQIAGVSRVAFVDDARAEAEFGIAEDRDELKVSHGEHSVDVCRLLAAGSATAFRAAIATSGTHIEIGQTFSEIWSTRFKSLATAPIKQIAIVDRYVMSKHHASPQTDLSGIERFLRLLNDQAIGPRDVSVYSAWTADLHARSIEDMATEIRLVLGRLSKPRRIRTVTLHMAPNTAFRDDGHDRFVRFGEYVWDLGLGLEVFEGAYSSRRSAAAFKTGESVLRYKEIEQDLARNHNTRRADI